MMNSGEIEADRTEHPVPGDGFRYNVEILPRLQPEYLVLPSASFPHWLCCLPCYLHGRRNFAFSFSQACDTIWSAMRFDFTQVSARSKKKKTFKMPQLDPLLELAYRSCESIEK